MDDEGFEGVEFHTPVGSFRAGKEGRPHDEFDDEYRRARRRVRRVMGAYRHLATFVSVILVLFIIDILRGPDDFPADYWSALVGAVWGIILVLHLLNVFVFDALIGREAEQRMIEREMRRRGGAKQ